MLRYLKEWGEISFEESALNDIDLLIFSQLSYMDFEGVQEAGCTLSEALVCAVFAESPDPSEARFPFQKKDDRQLSTLAASAPRYESVRFMGFTRLFDRDAQAQFACLTLSPDPDTLILAFRGTDNTLAGWKEDFNLAWMESIPAQRMALRYAEEMAQTGAKILLTGHSKGGNLALYAAAMLPEALQANILAAVSFDGPGLNEHIISSDGFARAEKRMRVILPRSSLVGRLFTQPGDVRLIESRVFSVLQHYPYFWKTEGNDFVRSDAPALSAEALSGGVRGLMEKFDPDLREQLIESVYEILSSTEADTFNGMISGWRKSGRAVLSRLTRLDRETRRLFIRAGLYFFTAAAGSLSFSSGERNIHS